MQINGQTSCELTRVKERSRLLGARPSGEVAEPWGGRLGLVSWHVGQPPRTGDLDAAQSVVKKPGNQGTASRTGRRPPWPVSDLAASAGAEHPCAPLKEQAG